jgi:hypothetical protein
MGMAIVVRPASCNRRPRRRDTAAATRGTLQTARHSPAAGCCGRRCVARLRWVMCHLLLRMRSARQECAAKGATRVPPTDAARPSRARVCAVMLWRGQLAYRIGRCVTGAGAGATPRRHRVVGGDAARPRTTGGTPPGMAWRRGVMSGLAREPTTDDGCCCGDGHGGDDDAAGRPSAGATETARPVTPPPGRSRWAQAAMGCSSALRSGH